MRKASSVMKKSLISGQSSGKPSTASAGITDVSRTNDPATPEKKRRGTISKKSHATPMLDGDHSAHASLQPSDLAIGGNTSAVNSNSGDGGSSLDLPILPSTSTFTLSGKEDKAEKLRKKAKTFLDERQKIKSRAQSLWSYIDATNTFDQGRFFQENAEQVFYVTYEICMHNIEKIKQKSERPQSWSSKELVSLQKNLLLLRKIFLYIPELMRNGWERVKIAKLLSHVLDHRNHLRLRALGFHLLLLWLNDQVVEYPECMSLFANAISLDLFILDDVRPVNNAAKSTDSDAAGTAPHPDEKTAATTHKHHSGGLSFVKKLGERHTEQPFGQGLARDERVKTTHLRLEQELIQGDARPPLFPSSVQPTFHDSIVLLHIFITNLVRLAYVAAGSPPPPNEYEYPPGDQIETDDGIATGVGIDAATASAKFLFRIFRTHYLTKFTPEVAIALGVEGVPKDYKDFGFKTCPPSILRTLLRFLIGYCLDNSNEAISTNGQWSLAPTIAAPSPATPIMKSIVLSSYETREMLHEILRQTLVLPCTNSSYRDITRGAIHIIGVWILGSEEERPSFLRRVGSSTTIMSTMARTSSTETPPLSSDKSSAGKSDYKDADANRILRRYFLMIQSMFENQPLAKSANAASMSQTEWEALINLYKDAINVYRAIAVSRGGIDMEWESWQLLLRCLLHIQKVFMSGSEKYAYIPIQSLADDFSDYLIETLLHAFARAKIEQTTLWSDLKSHMIASMSWPQTLSQWTKIMSKLTCVVSSRLYKVEYDSLDARGLDEALASHFQSVPTSGNRTRSKVRSRHLSIQGDTPRTTDKRVTSRPLSTGGSEGQLVDFSMQDRAQLPTTPERPTDVTTESSSHPETNSIFRNMSSISLADRVNVSSRSADRRSTYIGDLDEVSGDEEGTAPSSSNSVGRTGANLKFGIKNIMPTSALSPSSNATTSQGVNTVSSASGAIGGGRSRGNVRRTMSIHQLDTLWQDSGSKLLNFVHNTTGETQQREGTDMHLAVTRHGPSGATAVAKDSDKSKQGATATNADWDRRSVASSLDKQGIDENPTMSSKSNRTSISTILPTGEVISMAASSNAANEGLPAGLAWFRSSEFLNLQNLPLDGNKMLGIWKNMLCVIGDVNQIKNPQNHAVAMTCIVGIWDTLAWVRSRQPYRGLPEPALHEFTPWLLQAIELPSSFNIGRSAAYGCLCRIVSQRTNRTDTFADSDHIYCALIKGLSSGDDTLIQSIMLNSERLFSFGSPGVYILVPSFINAIENQLLEKKSTPVNVRRSCITILGSLVTLSNHLEAIKMDLSGIGLEYGTKEQQFAFGDVKVWLKNLLTRLVSTDSPIDRIEQDIEAHCMLLDAITALMMDELLSSQNPQWDIIYECILALVNHFYWSNVTIVNCAVDCHNTLAQVYSEDLDPDGVIIQEVLTRIVDALNMHLKHYERNNKNGRGYIVSRLLSCLLEWLMVIKPSILSDTELCQLVFHVVEYALHMSMDGAEKMLPHPPLTRPNGSKKKEIPFKFKIMTEKRPNLHPGCNSIISGSDMAQNDQDYVKESAEAVLLHLLNHFSNFAPRYGPATIHSTIAGPGVATEETGWSQYQYFSFNDTTIIAFVELDTPCPQTRLIMRDLTGRYVWDVKSERSECEMSSPGLESSVSHGDIIGREKGFPLRQGVPVRTDDQNRTQEATEQPLLANMPNKLGKLLENIGETYPECLPPSRAALNTPAPLTELQSSMVGRISEQLDAFLANEKENNVQHQTNIPLWYSKMNILRRKDPHESLHAHLAANFSVRKDFLPAFPQDPEKPHVPFQQSRLLLSHLGFINYDHLKDGSFQMLQKSPALFRDLKGLDRKHGRETMKMAVVYVGPGQEDEQSILRNDSGSAMYNAFVNSLGWEIDIASHTGYLGGLERNLTNGTKATYYCSSMLEIIFHDVTKMPTEAEDPKQLKKKRHIGNDHVHIIWNEHARDYRIGTIGGDFGNAQIIVSPLPDGLFNIQVYRDAKIHPFGPLFDQMVVSQAILGPLVRATAIHAYRASIHNNFYSFYKCVYAQRANVVQTIINRHKIGTWSYEQFMEKIFMPEDPLS